MLVKTYGSAILGVNALMVTVEVNVSVGVGFFMVGLPDNAVKESAQRISSAFEESGFRIPGNKVSPEFINTLLNDIQSPLRSLGAPQLDGALYLPH